MVQKRNYKILILIISFFICCVFQSLDIDEISYCTINDDSQMGVIELCDGQVVEQTFTRPIEDIESIKLLIPTFARDNLSGVMSVEIYSDNKKVGSENLSVSDFEDGHVVDVDLNKNDGEVGDQMKVVISADSKQGEAVGLWFSEDTKLMDSSWKAGNIEKEGSLYIDIVYNNWTLSYIWLIYIILFFAIVFYQKTDRIIQFFDRKETWIFVSMFLFGFFVVFLRCGVMKYAMIYAEDGRYINNILNEGFLKSCLSTRSGSGSDFLNLGSYILLGISLLVNKCIYGWNIVHLPSIVAVISIVFLVFIAIYAYIIMNRINPMLGITSYIVILFVPMGTSNLEVFGRVLNLVFIFPIVALLIAMDMWEDRYNKSVKLYIGSILLLICGLSFPISFCALGIYILFGLAKALQDRKIKMFLRANWIGCVALLIGIFLLPMMLASKGAGNGLETNIDSLIEFVLARHFIYIWVFPWYNHLNDIIVVFLFIITLTIVGIALYKECKRTSSLINLFCFETITVFVSVFGSALMRLPMSSYFSHYMSTYPDRYYYGCNILYFILVLHSIYIVMKDYQKCYFVYSVFVVFYVGLLVTNPQTFPDVNSEMSLITGDKEIVDDWYTCLEHGTIEEDGRYEVVYAPYTFGAWKMQLPCEYVLTSEKNRRR